MCVCEGVHKGEHEFEIVCEHFRLLRCMRVCVSCEKERRRMC